MSDYDDTSLNYVPEVALFTNGSVFCSLSKEELEAERKAAEEDFEKFRLLMLAEKASRMSKDDFVKAYNEWQESECKYEEIVGMHRSTNMVEWDRYKYERETYDREFASALKISRWKTYKIIGDHVYFGVAVVIAAGSYNINWIVFLIAAGVSVISLSQILIKWYHWYKIRDIPKYINTWS